MFSCDCPAVCAHGVEDMNHFPYFTSNLINQGLCRKVDIERGLFMNVLKMICNRAESAMVDLVSPYLKRSDEEKRMFIKQIIQNNADLIPDYENETLTVVLHSLSAPRFNYAAQN